jgi:hypothetical protein
MRPKAGPSSDDRFGPHPLAVSAGQSETSSYVYAHIRHWRECASARRRVGPERSRNQPAGDQRRSGVDAAFSPESRSRCVTALFRMDERTRSTS